MAVRDRSGKAEPGFASDGQSLFFLDANGTFDTTLNSKGFPINGDYGNGFIKVSTKGNKLKVADYFNMFNTVSESDSDKDLGSGGTIVLPPMKDVNGKFRYFGHWRRQGSQHLHCGSYQHGEI